MAYVRKFTNVKVGTNLGSLAGGPQALTLNTAYLSTAVPCKHARQVIFRLTSTDGNAPAALTIQVSNAPDLSGRLSSTGIGYSVSGQAAGVMNTTGGNTMSITPNVGYSRMFHDFAVLAITANAASGHTGFTVDVEVVYDFDAADGAQSSGQLAVTPL